MKTIARRWWRGLVLAAAVALAGSCGGGGDAVPVAPATISLLAGSLQAASPKPPGSQDGPGAQAQFNRPLGVAQDAAGNVYVADGGNNTIRKIDPDGVVSTFAGAAGQSGSADGTGGAARFARPAGIAVAPSGDVYVADSDNHVVRKITPAGIVITLAGTAGQSGAVDGLGGAARFMFPHALALDPAGNLLVADVSGAIRKVAPDGTVTSFAGKLGASFLSSVLGDGEQARFRNVSGVAVSGDGVVYVSEAFILSYGRVRRFDSQARALSWGDGSHFVEVPNPEAIAAGAGGDLVVANSGMVAPVPSQGRIYNSILRITPGGTLEFVAGRDGFLGRGSTDGPGSKARFDLPSGVSVGRGGRIVVADEINQSIRQIDTQGLVSTLAGGAGGTGVGPIDGDGMAAQFTNPVGLVAAPDGALYVADSGNALVRRVSPAGGVSTLWMTGCDATLLNTLPRPNVSFGRLAVASDGTLYAIYMGWLGLGIHRMAVAESSGRCREAQFATEPWDYDVFGMAAAPDGVYYTALSGGKGRVQKLLPDGTVQDIASGFQRPRGIVIDEAGTLFVADEFDHTVSAIDRQGAVRLVAGKPGEAGYAEGAGDQARLDQPSELTIDKAGNLYVADASTIRKITPQGRVSTVAGTPGQSIATPGPLPGSIGRVKGLAWRAGMLYATAENAVLAIGPLQ